MACISPDGTLSEPAKVVLRALEPGRSLEDVAAQVDLPLYRIRSSVRELVQGGLVEEAGPVFRTTAAGRAKLG